MLGMRGDRMLGKAIAAESPLLAGFAWDELNSSERSWVSDQVQARIDVLS